MGRAGCNQWYTRFMKTIMSRRPLWGVRVVMKLAITIVIIVMSVSSPMGRVSCDLGKGAFMTNEIKVSSPMGRAGCNSTLKYAKKVRLSWDFLMPNKAFCANRFGYHCEIIIHYL